jgi:hypothetical protein
VYTQTKEKETNSRQSKALSQVRDDWFARNCGLCLSTQGLIKLFFGGTGRQRAIGRAAQRMIAAQLIWDSNA